MYRHLLVPLDATDVSIDIVADAVDLAASAGSRVTFLHVVPESVSPRISGSTKELLAKAEAAARAWGVPCEGMSTVSDDAVGAIAAAARDRRCDLVIVASPVDGGGGTGATLAAETVGVLMGAGISVLVAACAPLEPQARLIAVLRDEHRALAAVLHAWHRALAARGGSNRSALLDTMRMILRYVERFETQHHSKERHLFGRLRERTSRVDADLDELERQHERGLSMLGHLTRCVDAIGSAEDDPRYEAAVRLLEHAAGDYADFVWDHLGREEAVVLPAARRFLMDGDWAYVETAFNGSHGAPSSAEVDRESGLILSHIVESVR